MRPIPVSKVYALACLGAFLLAGSLGLAAPPAKPAGGRTSCHVERFARAGVHNRRAYCKFGSLAKYAVANTSTGDSVGFTTSSPIVPQVPAAY